jgi:hypothetical protein
VGPTVTPEQFADEHGLSLDEALLILEKRKRKNLSPADRLSKARAALEAAQKKTGVHPVVEGYDELVRANDPEADIGLERFYRRKGQATDVPPDYDQEEYP